MSPPWSCSESEQSRPERISLPHYTLHQLHLLSVQPVGSLTPSCRDGFALHVQLHADERLHHVPETALHAHGLQHRYVLGSARDAVHQTAQHTLTIDDTHHLSLRRFVRGSYQLVQLV